MISDTEERLLKNKNAVNQAKVFRRTVYSIRPYTSLYVYIMYSALVILRRLNELYSVRDQAT
jgi:hypothetical protein